MEPLDVSPGYGHGEHQVCREDYQTQTYRVSLVPVPLRGYLFSGLTCSQEGLCTTRAIEITEVKCADQIETKCSNVATIFVVITILTVDFL